MVSVISEYSANISLAWSIVNILGLKINKQKPKSLSALPGFFATR